MVLGWQMAVALLSPPPLLVMTPAAIEEELLSDPQSGSLMRAWRRAEPASFQQFVSNVSQNARGGAAREELIVAARADMMAAAVPRYAHLNDAQMLEMARVAREEFRQLARTHPATCRPLFLGQPFGDITAYVSADVVQRELALIEGAFAADVSVEQAILRGPGLNAAIDALFAGLQTDVGDDANLLSAGADITGKEARYCEVVATMYGRIETMPLADAAALMRGLREAS